MNDLTSTTAAVVILLGGTTASLTLTWAWATANRRPLRRRPHLTGRAAQPYWHHPSGLQDERAHRWTHSPS